MSASYKLSSAGEADLRTIIRYTRKQWGDVQASRYLAELKGCIESLVAGRVPFQALASIHPDLRTRRCAHHHIFCVRRDTEPALVVAIFHERMNLMQRLAGRLE